MYSWASLEYVERRPQGHSRAAFVCQRQQLYVRLTLTAWWAYCTAYWTHIGLKSHLDLLAPGWHPFAAAPTTMEWADPLSLYTWL